MVTMKPARTSSSTIRVMRKNTEVEKPFSSRNSTRQATNRIIDSEWLMIATLRLLVDFRSSMNITTRAAARNRSPRVTGQAPPEVMRMVNSGWMN